jgi:hypothetical protein
MDELRLEVREYQGPARWLWVLTGRDGELLVSHQVRLDVGRWEYDAFTDLTGYMRLHVAPDRRAEDEARIVAGVGEWIGEHVLGPVGPALAAARPATVRVIVPEEAGQLMFCPLELAHVDSVPVALQDVALVMQPGGRRGAPRNGDRAPVGERLRVLGLFSLPVGEQPLNLRRERLALVRLFSEIADMNLSVEVQVLQYGVTRRRLKQVLKEAEGWDVIHISGHGAPGELLLEKEDGSPDPVGGTELEGLLGAARRRLKLVTVSACWSAAAAQRGLLGLPMPEGAARETAPARSLATDLAGLGCAVLAMRYPVTDDFAISLAGSLYPRLADAERVQLPRALTAALRDAVAVPPTAACPALSVACPALFGTAAADLRLAIPARSSPQPLDTVRPKLEGFPPQPERFVGRTTAMTRASAALAPRSLGLGVLLHGMPGAGKTACALELAYTHEHAFRTLIWFRAPDEGHEIAGALTEFSLTLESGLPGLQMAHLLDDAGQLAAFLPKLTRQCEQQVMIVVDNIESLLTEDGQWRDTRWGQVIGAICAHAGLGRVVLTSRRVPVDLNARVSAVPVDALSLEEALLLVRELPHLARLVDGSGPGIDAVLARKLARGVLNIAQGHPKLLELADGQAADPEKLQKLLEAGDQAWRKADGLPEGFLTTGEPQAAGDNYLYVLATWTRSVSDGLPSGDRDLFWFLCCLEEVDRAPYLLMGGWPILWRSLGRPGQPGDLGAGLAAISALGLIAAPHDLADLRQPYEIHPAVAAAGRAQAGGDFQAVVDGMLGALWTKVVRLLAEREAREPIGRHLVRAGFYGIPYLLRLNRWQEATVLLEEVLIRDHSRAAAAAALPALRAIADMAAPEHRQVVTVVLSRALKVIAPAQGEQAARAALADALARHDYRAATALVGDLAAYCRDAGRLGEALAFIEKKTEYTRLGGYGPWSQLSDSGQRLGVLANMGQAEQVLADVRRLRERMETLAETSAQPEFTDPWRVREGLLGVGRDSAMQLGRWAEALELNNAVIHSRQDRGAPAAEIAVTQFNAYGPLLRLGRLEEALGVLRECREAFESAHNVNMVGRVLGALADVEDQRGRHQVAADLASDALRYGYLAERAESIQVDHHNVGNFRRRAGQLDRALAHHLAAALIGALTGRGDNEGSLKEAAVDLRAAGDTATIPTDVAELCRHVAEVPGVRLDRLLATFGRDSQTIQLELDKVIVRARVLSAGTDPRLAAWDPVIAGLIAAEHGSATAAALLDEWLDTYGRSPDWAQLAPVLRHIRDGNRHKSLRAGLDAADAALVTRTLDVLAGHATVPGALWGAMPIAGLLALLVSAAHGDARAAQGARQVLDALAHDPDQIRLAHALTRILDGNNDPSLVSTLEDQVDRAVVATVLYYIRGGQPRTM